MKYLTSTYILDSFISDSCSIKVCKEILVPLRYVKKFLCHDYAFVTVYQ